MRRRRGLSPVRRALALTALGMAGACANAASPPADPAGHGISLRLAHGTVIRIPCDKTIAGCVAAAPPENAWIAGSARRAPLKRGAKLFDASKPGVVAGIRG